MNIFNVKNSVITYTVDRVTTSNCYIAVQNGEVVVNAPWYLTSAQIQQIVEEKKQWILEKLNKTEEKAYIRREVVKILGEDCKVIINYKNLKKPTLTVEGKNIKIELPNKYKKLNKDEILIKLIEKLYDFIAAKEIEAIMEKVRIALSIAPEDYKLERNEKVLAKCSQDGIITINPDIMAYSPEVIEYVIAHQFCHLKYKNHTQKFYKMLESYIPNYKEIEESIKNKTF